MHMEESILGAAAGHMRSNHRRHPHTVCVSMIRNIIHMYGDVVVLDNRCVPVIIVRIHDGTLSILLQP